MKKTLLKGAGIFVAIAFAFSAVPASALTTAQLVSLLQSLGVSADVIAIVSATYGGSTGTTTTCPTFTRDLTIGSTGSDVVELQTFLESKGYLTIPAGVSKGYFGTLTASAVARMQSANGIAPAVGYFGPITRSKVATMCTPVVVTPPTTPTTPGSGLSGGDGDIQNVKKITSGTETTVGEGTEENVLGFEIEADDNSDLQITSVRVVATAVGAGSNRLNRYVDEVIIYQGDDEVGSMDASDFSRTGSKHTATISLKGAVVDAGEKERFYVAFVGRDTIDSKDVDTQKFEVEVDRIRFVDANGAVLSEGPFSPKILETVDFELASENDDVRLQSSNDDPDARTIVVEETSTSDEEVVFAFKLKAGSKSSDVNILSIPVEFTITNGASSTSAEKIFNDLWLEVDGQTYDDYTMAGSATTIDGSTTTTRTAVFTIDEGDLVVEGGDSVDVLVYAKFGKQKDNYSSGTKISGKVTAAGIDAENENGDDVEIKGASSVTGEDQTLLSTGITATTVSESFVAEKPADQLAGTISITFKVTAVGDEFSIDENATDLVYTLSGATTTGKVVSVKGKTAKSGNFILTDGKTEEMTLSIKFASTTGFVKLAVNSIKGYTVSNVETKNN
jgi:peptidoglycan hydrolase-like protein with peptidoglycan-binding domain